MTARRSAYAESYIEEVINSASEKYKQYDYNALMAAEKVLETALKVLPDDKQLKEKLNYYRNLEPVRLTDLDFTYQSVWFGSGSYLTEMGSQTSVSGYVYNYTLSPGKLTSSYLHEPFIYEIRTMKFDLNYQYSKLTGKFFFNEKYKTAASEKVCLRITPSDGQMLQQNYNNNGKTYGFTVGLTGSKSFLVDFAQTSDLTDLAFLADVYLWK